MPFRGDTEVFEELNDTLLENTYHAMPYEELLAKQLYYHITPLLKILKLFLANYSSIKPLNTTLHNLVRPFLCNPSASLSIHSSFLNIPPYCIFTSRTFCHASPI